MQNKNQAFSFRLRCAMLGIRTTWQREASFRTHSFCLAALLALLFFLRPSPVWWALLLLTSSAVLLTEMINTALEEAMDLLHPGLHPAVKRIKDGAAGAVLLASGTAVGIFCLFLWSQFHKNFF